MIRSNSSDDYFLVALMGLLFVAILTNWAPWAWAANFQQAGLLLLGVAWGIRQIFRPVPVVKTWLLVPLALAALCGPLQLAAGRTAYPFVTVTKSLEWLTYLVIFFIALQCLAVDKNVRHFRKAALYFGFALSAVSIVQYWTSGGDIFWLFPNGYSPRVLGPFVNYDHYATFMELLIPLAIYNGLRNRTAVRYCLMAGAMFASVIAGGSRAGAILSALTVLLTILLIFRSASSGRIRMRGKAAFVVAFLAIFTLVAGWELAWTRLNLADPFQGRRELNTSSLRMIRERPWTGFGQGTWTYVYPAHAVYISPLYVNAAHNDWAQWAVEGGIGFFGLMLSVFVWSALRASRFPWAIGVPIFLIHCMVDFPMQVHALALWFFVMLAALAAASNKPDVLSRERRTLPSSQPGSAVRGKDGRNTYAHIDPLGKFDTREIRA